MGANTKIQWTAFTWNPFQGCHKISEGCKNCYMFADKKRYKQDGNNVIRSQNATFFKPLAWHKKITQETPLADRLVFTASWSDWFIEENDPHRAEAWEVIRKTPNLIYQILTKRADRIKECLPDDWGSEGYPNVWLGVSCENQRRADERIPLLLDVPARIRFLSCEPLIDKIDFWLCRDNQNPLGINCLAKLPDASTIWRESIDWVIVGGESGDGARNCDLDWIRFIVGQCQHNEVPVFVKQLGKYPLEIRQMGGTVHTIGKMSYREITTEERYYQPSDKKGGDINDFPDELQFRQMPFERFLERGYKKYVQQQNAIR